MILILFLFGVIMVAVLKPAFSNNSKQPIQASGNISTQPPKSQQSQYSTVVNMKVRSQFGPSKLMCKDGVVYATDGGRKIGRYEKFSDDTVTAFWEEKELGMVTGRDDSNARFIMFMGTSRVAIEVNERRKTIWDDRDNITVASYEGEASEAGAAFICWAFDSAGNKYSDLLEDRKLEAKGE